MATIEFHGPDLVVYFDSNPANVAVDHYVVEYECLKGTITHRVDQAAFQAETPQGSRSYQDALTYAENDSAGLTRNVRVSVYAVSDKGRSPADAEDAQNSIPVLPGPPQIVSTLTGVEVFLPTPADGDLEGFVAWVHTDATVPLTTPSERYRGKANAFSLQLPDEGTYYLRVAPYDAFGLDTFAASAALPIKRTAIDSRLATAETIKTINKAIEDGQAAADKITEAARLEQERVNAAAEKLRIDLSNTIDTEVDEAKAEAANALKNGIDGVSQTIRELQAGGSVDSTARASIRDNDIVYRAADKALVDRQTELTTAIGDANGRITTNETVLTAKEAAITKRIDDSQSEYKTLNSNLDARVTREVQTIAGTTGSLAQRADTLEARTNSGGNLLTNTEWATGTDGWAFGTESGSIAARNGITGDQWWPVGMNCLVIGQENASRERGGYWYQTVQGIEPGQFYQFSVYASAHRCLTTAYVDWIGVNGNGVGYGGSSNGGDGNNGSRLINTYARPFVTAQAPASATGMRVYLMKQGTHAGENSYAWFLRPQVVKVDPKTTVAVPYTAGNGSAEQVQADARIKTVEAVTTNGTFATATRATTLEAQMNRTSPSEMGRVLDVVDGRVTTVNTQLGARIKTVEDATTNGTFATATRTATLEATVAAASNSIVRNDTFNSWPDGQTHPSHWAAWSSGGNYRTERVAPGRGGGQYCVRTLNDVAGVDSGFVQTIYTAGAGKWVVEVTVNGDASGLSGSGVTLHGVWNLDFLLEPDTNGYRGDSTAEVRSWTKMFDIDGRDQINVHAMHGWSGFSSPIVAKYMVWHRLSLRPATAGEILAGKADDTLNKPGGLVAKVDSHESAIVNLPANYATASRASNLEAQMNGNSASNLLSKITNLETVTSNGTFASATRANTLEAQLRREVPSNLSNDLNYVNGRIDTVAGTTTTTLNSRIEERASAWARQEAGGALTAANERMNVMVSEYNGIGSTVREQAGTLASVDGRTKAYWQVAADAGNGRAQLTVAADGYGGRIDIVGDVRISGGLVVDGTITSGKFAPSSVQQVAFVTLTYDISVPRGGTSPGTYTPGTGGGGGGGGGGWNPEMPNQN